MYMEIELISYNNIHTCIILHRDKPLEIQDATYKNGTLKLFIPLEETIW